MKNIAIIAALALTAACVEAPSEDDIDIAPDQVTSDQDPEIEDAGDGAAPELANVQAAIDRECPTLRARVETASCLAENMGQSFSCTYAFAQDPEGTERTVTLTSEDAGWVLNDEPDFCGSLERANIQADMAADAAPAE